MPRLVARASLVVIALVAMAVCAGGALTSLGCCAIDAERFPEQAALNAQRQRDASLLALGACVTAIGAMAAAVRLGRRSRGARVVGTAPGEGI